MFICKAELKQSVKEVENITVYLIKIVNIRLCKFLMGFEF